MVSPKSMLTRPIRMPKAAWVEPGFFADEEHRDITSDGLLRASSFKGLSKGTGRPRQRSSFMTQTTRFIFTNSFEIAWDYLEATGEFGNPDRPHNTSSIPLAP